MLPIKLTSPSQILSVIRRAAIFSENAISEDDRLALESGLWPKSLLRSLTPDYPAEQIRKLIEAGKIHESPSYLRANPRDRTRPIATMYRIEKPRVSPSTRNATSYNIFGRDRLALWYAAANDDYSGSRGEAYGLWLILRFWRLPNVQKIWRRHIARPRFRLPPDAR